MRTGYPTLAPLLLLSLAGPAILGGCSNDPVHFARPDLFAGKATLWDKGVDLEVIAANNSDTPMWIRRFDLSIEAAEADIATGVWEGERQIDPGASVLFGINIPVAESAPLPPTDTPATLHLRTQYARSGVIGLLGGERFDTDLPLVLRRGQSKP
ncbi:MAG: hypothetical protein IPJ41_04715 [Phycisphaerales bacterium]|nr:hypothetical protein [Phycisphaerales bacterium]